MISVIKSPSPLPLNRIKGVIPNSIFLAGSIEGDTAEKWQDEVVKTLSSFHSHDYKNYTILNPRRDSWDSSWKQSIDNPQFNEQVSWELTALDLAETIFMYFDPNTKSPISLLELGLYANSGKLMVCCPDGFWRKGNVEIVCKRYDIPLFAYLPKLLECYKVEKWQIPTE